MADVEILHKYGIVMGDVTYDPINRYAHLGRLIVNPVIQRRNGVGTLLHKMFVQEALTWGNIAIVTFLDPDKKSDMESTRIFLEKLKYTLFEYQEKQIYRKFIDWSSE
ncbi:hypothetical protein KBD69_00205 [Candidatus Woesebacteria bacterium]|nr:hypothetical protein [Candidatus Woesebacteria bacterium]